MYVQCRFFFSIQFLLSLFLFVEVFGNPALLMQGASFSSWRGGGGGGKSFFPLLSGECYYVKNQEGLHIIHLTVFRIKLEKVFKAESSGSSHHLMIGEAKNKERISTLLYASGVASNCFQVTPGVARNCPQVPQVLRGTVPMQVVQVAAWNCPQVVQVAAWNCSQVLQGVARCHQVPSAAHDASQPTTHS